MDNRQFARVLKDSITDVTMGREGNDVTIEAKGVCTAIVSGYGSNWSLTIRSEEDGMVRNRHHESRMEALLFLGQYIEAERHALRDIDPMSVPTG